MTARRNLTCCQAWTRAALCGVYKYSGAMAAHEWLARACGQQFLSILLFHRVTDVIPEDGLTVSPRRFERICRLLADRFQVVPLAEVFRLLHTGRPFPARTLAITFDDSYRNNLDAAAVLARYRLPATFFLPTAFVDTTRVFDWDRGLPHLPNLTWDDVRRLADLGFDIGSHTVSHANMGAVSAAQARYELAESKAELERQLRRPVRWFAYPYGGRQHLRPEYLPLIREVGYEGAVSAYGGFVWPGMDDAVLPREAVPYFRSLAHMELYLAGCLNWLYAIKGKASQPTREPWPYPPTEGEPPVAPVLSSPGRLAGEADAWAPPMPASSVGPP
ncbi:MAG: polysaccharide deacetylase family protein [Gemmataceae bacterium]